MSKDPELESARKKWKASANRYCSVSYAASHPRHNESMYYTASGVIFYKTHSSKRGSQELETVQLLMVLETNKHDSSQYQINVPGGKREVRDDSPPETALREFLEEVCPSAEIRAKDAIHDMKVISVYWARHAKYLLHIAPLPPSLEEHIHVGRLSVDRTREVMWVPLRSWLNSERVETKDYGRQGFSGFARSIVEEPNFFDVVNTLKRTARLADDSVVGHWLLKRSGAQTSSSWGSGQQHSRRSAPPQQRSAPQQGYDPEYHYYPPPGGYGQYAGYGGGSPGRSCNYNSSQPYADYGGSPRAPIDLTNCQPHANLQDMDSRHAPRFQPQWSQPVMRGRMNDFGHSRYRPPQRNGRHPPQYNGWQQGRGQQSGGTYGFNPNYGGSGW